MFVTSLTETNLSLRVINIRYCEFYHGHSELVVKYNIG